MILYKVVEEINLVTLEKVVNILINEGWYPQGGVYGEVYEDQCYYTQAMLARKGDKEQVIAKEGVKGLDELKIYIGNLEKNAT